MSHFFTIAIRKMKNKKHQKQTKPQFLEQPEDIVIDRVENYYSQHIDKKKHQLLDVDTLLSAANQDPQFNENELLKEY